MARRFVKIVALGVAVAAALGAATLVRQLVDGPGPADVVRSATDAYASGDCEALRRLTVDPRSVDCDTVTEVRDAYRSEGLEPSTFRYAVVSRTDDDATVRISYRRGPDAEQELVQVRRGADGWKVFPPRPTGS